MRPATSGCICILTRGSIQFLGRQEVYDKVPAVQDRLCFYQLNNGRNVH